MPRKSKVETSPHFEEIVDLLLQGKSGRKISDYLKNEYNEDIGFNAINTYRRKHINLEDKVLREVDKRLSEKAVKEKVDTLEHIEESTQAVVNATANQLQGLLAVGANFQEDYEAMKKAVADPTSKVSEKDVAEMSWKANKLSLEFIKTEENTTEINIENNMGSLSNLFDVNKIKSRLNEKRNRKSD